MKTKQKSFICVVLLIGFAVGLPLTQAFSIEKGLDETNDALVYPGQENIRVELFRYQTEGVVKESEEMSYDEVLTLLGISDTIDLNSDTLRSDLLKVFSDSYSLTSNPEKTAMMNMLCQVNAKMLGLGFVLGTHSIPVVSLLKGVDIGGLFLGVGSVDLAGGIMDDMHHSGLCLGGLLGFVGSIYLVFLPMIPGPVVFIDGFSLAAFWL